MSKASESFGVQKVRVDPDRAGQRLDNFLSARLKGLPRSVVYKMIRTGQVRVNGRRCKVSTRLEEGDEVRLPPARLRERDEVRVPASALQALERAVLYSDADLLVVDKPSGMAVHSGSGLAWGLIDVLRAMHPDRYIELAHRLDRETSGCLVLARSGRALEWLSAQFRGGEVRKSYLCLLEGRMKQDVIEVGEPLARVQAGGRRLARVSPDGKPALTRFRLLQAFEGCCYVSADLLTGRTHQIRAHARHLGTPLAGDDLYGSRASARQWRKRGLKRIFLHAHRLGLDRPSGGPLEVEAPLPPALRGVLDALEGR